MPINWEILLHELETGKCVLCIGPDVFSAADQGRVESRLADTLRAGAKELGIRVYDDGWFHYLPERDELATWFKVKQFYEGQLPADPGGVFQTLAQLPFHLALYFSPDYRLREAFRASGRSFEFDCLYRNPEASRQRLAADYEPDKAKPLVFNMLGEIDEKDSLVMTYDDFYGYMEAVFEKKRMPTAVKLKLQQATHFIFLGMPLDKWYFHLFMRVLNMHRETKKSKRLAVTFGVNGTDASFSEEQYTLTFVQNDIAGFAALLAEKWQAAQQAKSGGAVKSRYERWRGLAATGEDIPMRQLFTEVKEFLRHQSSSSGDMENKLVLFEMQWNGFTSTFFETMMQKNAVKTQIVRGVLSLLDEIEKSYPDNQP